MSYADFLTLIKENTSHKLNDYKKLCRFCLEDQTHGIDMSDDNNKSKQERDRRDSILNNYVVITKKDVRQMLP